MWLLLTQPCGGRDGRGAGEGVVECGGAPQVCGSSGHGASPQSWGGWLEGSSVVVGE